MASWHAYSKFHVRIMKSFTRSNISIDFKLLLCVKPFLMYENEVIRQVFMRSVELKISILFVTRKGHEYVFILSTVGKLCFHMRSNFSHDFKHIVLIQGCPKSIYQNNNTYMGNMGTKISDL